MNGKLQSLKSGYSTINPCPTFSPLIYDLQVSARCCFAPPSVWNPQGHVQSIFLDFPAFSYRKRQFVHKIVVHNFCAPWPPSQPAKWWISSWISIKRTSNRIANTQPKLRTNPPKIANKQNYEQTGVSDLRIRAPQKGPENGCRAKIVKKCRKYGWHFLTIFDVFCPARTMSKSVENSFDTLWRFLTRPLSAGPFCGPLIEDSGNFHGKDKRSRKIGPNSGTLLDFLLGDLHWEKLNRGVSKPGCFPLFSGKVQIVSRTLSGLFLVGARHRPRRGKGQIGKIPGPSPSKSGKSQKKSGKSQKKEGQVQIRKPPPVWNPPV